MDQAKKAYHSKPESRTALRIKKLNEKRLQIIEKMSLKKDGIARKQLLFSFFGPKSKIQEKVVETPQIEETESTKTK